MSFSASTCLSYTGTTILINPLTLYSDTDGYNSSFGSLSLSAITGGNCPCIISNIPDGTTKIKLLSKNNYCVFVDILCNQICDVCNLSFTGNTNTIGKLSIGALTGSCQPNISDYLINWYGPDSLTNIAFSSGKGTKYTYGYEQPFSDLIQVGGVYRPRIQKIILTGITSSPTSGITFSLTGSTGQVLADLNCLPNVTVQDFNCSNGNSVATYSHSMSFNSKSNNVLPTPLNAKFLLTGTTKYFALSFNCFSYPDTIKITYSGTNYSNPIVLQNMILSTTTNTNPTTIPRQIGSQSYTNILCLTGLSMTTNDFLTITVTPNTTVGDTNWSLSLKCLGDFDTTFNGYEIFKNQSYKLSASTITFNSGACNTISVGARLIGIQSGATPLPIYTYLGYTANQNGPVTNVNTNTMYPSGNTNCNFNETAIPGNSEACTSSNISGDIVNFKRVYSATTSAATYNMEFSTYSAFTDSYSSALNAVTNYSGSSDPTTVPYYNRIRVRHYYGTFQTTTCQSDNRTYADFLIHPATLVITTGITTGGLYNLRFVQKVLPPANNLGYNGCDLNCQANINGSINSINNSTMVVAPNNFSSTVGLRTKSPFIYYGKLNKVTAGVTTSSNIASAYVMYNNYANLMIPYSANPISGVNTVIPSLSSVTSNSIYNSAYHDTLRNIQRLGHFDVYLRNPANNYKDFEIYAREVINYNLGPAPGVLAYRYSGGVVTYSSSTYII